MYFPLKFRWDVLKLQWSRSSDRSRLLFCDIHLSVTVGWGLQSIDCWLYFEMYSKIKVKKIEMTYGQVWSHTRNSCSAFNPSKACAHAHTHTHTHTHTQSSGQPLRHPGSSWGSVPCSRSPQSWYWRTFPPTYNPCRTWDSNSQPLDYKSDSLTIRPWLPHKLMWD